MDHIPRDGTFGNHTSAPNGPLIPFFADTIPSDIRALIDHAYTLLHRFQQSRKLEDANSAIKHLRHLLEKPLDDVNVRHPVITSLIEMLAKRVNLKGDASALEDTYEIMDLCSKTPNSQDTSTPCTDGAFKALTSAVGQSIERLRETCPPGTGSSSRADSFNLANVLVVRFLTSQNDDDYEEATQVLHTLTITDPRAPWDRKAEYHIEASSLTRALGIAQSILFSNPENSEDAITRCLSFIDQSSDFCDPVHPLVIHLLRRHATRLSEHLGHRQGTTEARSGVDHARLSLWPRLGLVGGGVGEHDITQTVPSLVEVEEKIRGLRAHLSTTTHGTDRRKDCVTDLLRWYDVKIHQTRNVKDITEAIKLPKAER
jgi:hypothetical protein